MARTISLVAAVSLALMGFVFVTWGSSPEASILDRVALEEELRPDLSDHWKDRIGVVASRPAPAAPTAMLRPAPRPAPVGARPPVRPYAATGPMAHRIMDPAFGRPQIRPASLLVPDPPTRLAGASDLLCMAVAIYHEARDQPLDGQLAIASVILNRTGEPERWGASPCEVVVPVQFSFFAEDGSYPAIPKDEAWAIAVEMASETLERGPSPLVGAADHYHTPAVDPDWNENMDQVVRIEDHIFFIDTATRG